MATKKKKIEAAEPEVVRTLAALAPLKGSRKRRKRVGFGEGSGHGKTCCKGQKGQTSRSGFGLPKGFEGGQMPLHRRLPKIGFTSRKKLFGINVYSIVKLTELAELEVTGDITVDLLREKGLVRSRAKQVKILGNEAPKKKLVVEVHAISAAAKTAIESAGGTVRLIS